MKNNLLLGVLLTLLATLAYSLQTAIVKANAAALPLPLIVFMQSALGLIFMLPIILKRGLEHTKNTFKTKKMMLHILRACGSLCISYLLFFSVKFIPLVNAMLLANTAPLIIPFIAYLFVGQKINHSLWLPLIIGFIGISFVLHPNGEIFNISSFLAIGAAIAMAVTLLIVRKLSKTDSSETITTYFLLFSSLISGVIAIPFWIPLSPKMLLILLTIGGLYFTCQYAMSYALKFSNAQLVGSLFYANIIYSAIISELVWKISPSSLTLFGIVMTIIGGILCIRAEHLQNKKDKSFIQPGTQYVTEKSY